MSNPVREVDDLVVMAEVHGLAVEITFILHEVCLIVDNGCFAAQFGTDVVDGAFFADIAIAVFDVADVFAVELDLADLDVSAFAGRDEAQEIDGTVLGIAVKFQINGQVAVGSCFDSEAVP